MSNHERVYDGTLHWPMALAPAGLICAAPAGERLPPWGLDEEGEIPEHPCEAVIAAPKGPGVILELDDIKDAIEAHMREAHGEDV